MPAMHRSSCFPTSHLTKFDPAPTANQRNYAHDKHPLQQLATAVTPTLRDNSQD